MCALGWWFWANSSKKLPSGWHENLLNLVKVDETLSREDDYYAAINPIVVKYGADKSENLLSFLNRVVLGKEPEKPSISEDTIEKIVSDDTIYCGTRSTWYNPNYLRGLLRQEAKGIKREGIPLPENFRKYSDNPLVGNCGEKADYCHVVDDRDFISTNYFCSKHYHDLGGELEKLGTPELPMRFFDELSWQDFYLQRPGNLGFWHYSGEIFPSKSNVVDDLARIHPGRKNATFYTGNQTNEMVGIDFLERFREEFGIEYFSSSFTDERERLLFEREILGLMSLIKFDY